MDRHLAKTVIQMENKCRKKTLNTRFIRVHWNNCKLKHLLEWPGNPERGEHHWGGGAADLIHSSLGTQNSADTVEDS